MRRTSLLLSSLLTAVTVSAQSTPTAIDGATIFLADGTEISNGRIVFSNGTIDAVGADVAIPDGARVIESDGLYVTPGFIDAHSHIGVDFDGLWTRESLMSASRKLAIALPPATESQWIRAGTTTVYVSPGPQNLVGGLGTVIKLTGERLDESAALSVSFGESALTTFAAPTTRQGMIGALRETLVRAQEDGIGGEDGRTLARVLFESLPTRTFVNTPDDILTALRLAEEFELHVVLDSAAGAHVVAEAIAEAGVPVVVGPTIIGMGDGGPYEGFAHTPANAGKLHAAGVRIAFGTNDAGRGRAVAMEAIVAKAHGLPESAALAAVTSEAAAILGIDDRVGSLEPGKDADIVVWENRPISTWAVTRFVIVDGETVFER